LEAIFSFFFSSRRRHTSFSRDWSSDVCSSDLEYVYAALRAGASGFLLKDAPTDDLLAAVRTVHRGDAVIAPSATRRLLAEVVPALPDVAARDRALAGLTERERDVVALLADGLSNAEIGARLFLAEA